MFTFWGIVCSRFFAAWEKRNKQTEQRPRKPTLQLCLVDFVVGVACFRNLMSLLWLCGAVCMFGWFILNLLVCPCVRCFSLRDRLLVLCGFIVWFGDSDCSGVAEYSFCGHVCSLFQVIFFFFLSSFSFSFSSSSSYYSLPILQLLDSLKGF